MDIFKTSLFNFFFFFLYGSYLLQGAQSFGPGLQIWVCTELYSLWALIFFTCKMKEKSIHLLESFQGLSEITYVVI